MVKKDLYKNRKFSFEVECNNEGKFEVLRMIREVLDKNHVAYHNITIKLV